MPRGGSLFILTSRDTGGNVYSPALEGSWVAVQVFCGSEKKVSSGLDHRGYETFVPSYKRNDHRERILFPGYVFCKFLCNPTFRIVSVPSVVRIVGAGPVPLAIPNQEIEGIQRIVASGYYAEAWKGIQTGQYAKVETGPLRGLIGIVKGVGRRARLVVVLTLLQRAVSVELDSECLAPLAEGKLSTCLR